MLSWTNVKILKFLRWSMESILINNNYINIEDISISQSLLLNVSLNRDDCFIDETDGLFSINLFGVNFPIKEFESTNTPEELFSRLNDSNANFSDRDQKNRFLKWIVSLNSAEKLFSIEKVEGGAKTFASIKPFYENLKSGEDFLRIISFVLACNGCKKTINNIKFSVAFNKLFSNITTQEEFDAKVTEMVTVLEKQRYFWRGEYKSYLKGLLDTLPEAREIKKDALKRKSTGAFNHG